MLGAQVRRVMRVEMGLLVMVWLTKVAVAAAQELLA
jgi:hypothetical protein